MMYRVDGQSSKFCLISGDERHTLFSNEESETKLWNAFNCPYLPTFLEVGWSEGMSGLLLDK
jgi:hypothetical protein